MLISTIFRLNYVKGFFPRTTTSTYASIHRPRVRPIVTSSVKVGAVTSSKGNQIAVPFIYQSSSLLAMSKSTSPSFIEESRGKNCRCVSLSIPTMEVMEEVGALIAILSHQTDVLFLDGDLGAGKTTFSRGFIKCKLGVADEVSESSENGDCKITAGGRVEQVSLRITSPTYLLSNTYEYRDDDDDGTIGEQTRE